MVWVCRLIKRVIAGNLGPWLELPLNATEHGSYVYVSSIALSQCYPEVDRPVLEFLVLPEKSFVYPRIGMPVLILSSRNRMHVENNI